MAGCLALTGAVLSLLALFPHYVETFRLVRETRIVWSVTINTAAVAIAGILLLAPATRRHVGPGVLLGCSTLALNAVIVGITLRTSDYYGKPGPGLWLDLTSGVVRTVAAVIVVVAVVGSGSLRLARRPEPHTWLALLAAVVGAVALYVEQRRAEWFVPDVDTATVTWTSIAAAVIPVIAAMTLPTASPSPSSRGGSPPDSASSPSTRSPGSPSTPPPSSHS